jgi:hypothetical protein
LHPLDESPVANICRMRCNMDNCLHADLCEGLTDEGEPDLTGMFYSGRGGGARAESLVPALAHVAQGQDPVVCQFEQPGPLCRVLAFQGSHDGQAQVR